MLFVVLIKLLVGLLLLLFYLLFRKFSQESHVLLVSLVDLLSYGEVLTESLAVSLWSAKICLNFKFGYGVLFDNLGAPTRIYAGI